jgi:dihydrofolate synthase/folylpolyglutamate synthase
VNSPQEALDYLYSFINRQLDRPQRYAPQHIPLARMERLLEALGNPHCAYPCLHLTGTKGKGSVGAMCAAMLQAGGLRVGLYSSPHLQDFCERIRLNDELLAPGRLLDLVRQIQPYIQALLAEGWSFTWFEVVTALAFLYFAQERPDIAVIEVGMGGRLDATNLVQPLVSVITSLSLDHTAFLGETLAQIATEKAGIIKAGVPVISAPQAPEALAILEERACSQNAPLTLIGREWSFQPLGGDLSTEVWQAAPKGQPLQTYQTVLLGEHQALNGTVALATLNELRRQGWILPDAALRQGLERVNWPGRMELVRACPWVVLDGAHNADSALRLAQTLQGRFVGQPRILVFAAKADKDIRGMLQALLPIFDHLLLTSALDTRASEPQDLAQLSLSLAPYLIPELYPDLACALKRAEALAGAAGLVCVTGSLYLVGEARTLYALPLGRVRQLEGLSHPCP